MSQPPADRTVYTAPERHMCKVWAARGPVGSVWRCGTCGGFWKRGTVSLVRAGGWYPMSRFELWQFRRRQRREPAPR